MSPLDLLRKGTALLLSFTLCFFSVLPAVTLPVPKAMAGSPDAAGMPSADPRLGCSSGSIVIIEACIGRNTTSFSETQAVQIDSGDNPRDSGNEDIVNPDTSTFDPQPLDPPGDPEPPQINFHFDGAQQNVDGNRNVQLSARIVGDVPEGWSINASITAASGGSPQVVQLIYQGILQGVKIYSVVLNSVSPGTYNVSYYVTDQNGQRRNEAGLSSSGSFTVPQPPEPPSTPSVQQQTTGPFSNFLRELRDHLLERIRQRSSLSFPEQLRSDTLRRLIEGLRSRIFGLNLVLGRE